MYLTFETAVAVAPGEEPSTIVAEPAAGSLNRALADGFAFWPYAIVVVETAVTQTVQRRQRG
jgi:hypothetical protein